MNEKTNPNTVAEAIAAEAIDDEMLAEYDFSQAVRSNPYQHLNQAPITIKTNTGDRDTHIKTVEVSATVAIDGSVTLQLPPEITPGEHRITLLIQENLTPQTA